MFQNTVLKWKPRTIRLSNCDCDGLGDLQKFHETGNLDIVRAQWRDESHSGWTIYILESTIDLTTLDTVWWTKPGKFSSASSGGIRCCYTEWRKSKGLRMVHRGFHAPNMEQIGRRHSTDHSRLPLLMIRTCFWLITTQVKSCCSIKRWTSNESWTSKGSITHVTWPSITTDYSSVRTTAPFFAFLSNSKEREKSVTEYDQQRRK